MVHIFPDSRTPYNKIARPSKPGRISYGVVNNYRTNFDDFKEVYLLGIQSAFTPFLYSLGVLPSVRLR